MWGWWKKNSKRKKKTAPKLEVFDLVIGTYRKRWRQWVEILASFIGVFALTKSINFIVPGGQPGVATLTGMAVFLILERASSFRFSKKRILLQQGRTEAAFECKNLYVDGPASYPWKNEQFLVFWDEENTFFLNCHAPLFYISTDAIWALAEMQKRGATIMVAGFGSYEYPEPNEHTDKYKAALAPLTWLGVLCLLIAAGFIIAAVAGLIPYFNLLPLLLLIPIFLLTKHVQNKLITHGEAKSVSCWIEVTEDEVLLHRRGKIVVQVKLEEIKTIFVTIDPKPLNFSKISIEVQTHYARSYKLLDRGGGLDFSQSLFLENARDLGLHIVYRRIDRGSEGMVVIHEVEAEYEPLLLDHFEEEQEFGWQSIEQ